jgi:hypothetical protein
MLYNWLENLGNKFDGQRGWGARGGEAFRNTASGGGGATKCADYLPSYGVGRENPASGVKVPVIWPRWFPGEFWGGGCGRQNKRGPGINPGPLVN